MSATEVVSLNLNDFDCKQLTKWLKRALKGQEPPFSSAASILPVYNFSDKDAQWRMRVVVQTLTFEMLLGDNPLPEKAGEELLRLAGELAEPSTLDILQDVVSVESEFSMLKGSFQNQILMILAHKKPYRTLKFWEDTHRILEDYQHTLEFEDSLVTPPAGIDPSVEANVKIARDAVERVRLVLHGPEVSYGD